jgi:hypothetical protein
MRVGAISYVSEYSRKGHISREKMRFYGCYAEVSLGPIGLLFRCSNQLSHSDGTPHLGEPIVALIDRDDAAKAAGNMVEQLSIVGNETPRAASSDAKVRRTSWSCHSVTPQRSSNMSLGFPHPLKTVAGLPLMRSRAAGNKYSPWWRGPRSNQIRDHSPVGERVGPLVLRHGRRQRSCVRLYQSTPT